MKLGRDLKGLAEELTRQAKSKRDFIVNTELLRMSGQRENNASDVTLLFNTDKENHVLPITSLAHNQIAERVGIPRPYYQRMFEEAPHLLADNVNHWFVAPSSKENRMVRTLDGTARAFLSAKYRPLDYYDLVEVALPSLEKSGMKIMSCDVTDTKLYLKAVSQEVRAAVPKVGDIVNAGVVISNSEVGCGSLSVEPMVYTLKCLNGMIGGDGRFKKMHVGRSSEEGVYEFLKDDTRKQDDRALWLKVRDVIEHAFDQVAFTDLVEAMGVAAEDRIVGDPIKAVEVTQKLLGLRDSERNGVLKHLLGDGDLTRYGLLNAITRHSQDVESYDRATELEKLGGYCLELPKRDWEKISEAE